MLLDHTLSDAAATPGATPLVGILKQGSKLGTDSTTPQHWCFLIPQRTDGSTYLLSLGICTTWVSAGFVCLYICAGCLPSTVSLHILVRFLVPQNPKGHSSLLTSAKACRPSPSCVLIFSNTMLLPPQPPSPRRYGRGCQGFPLCLPPRIPSGNDLKCGSSCSSIFHLSVSTQVDSSSDLRKAARRGQEGTQNPWCTATSRQSYLYWPQNRICGWSQDFIGYQSCSSGIKREKGLE